MNLKENPMLKKIACLSKEEKMKKTLITYLIVVVFCFTFILCQMGTMVSVSVSLILGFTYFLFGATPKIKDKKTKKEKIKKRSSLDEEYLREYDEKQKSMKDKLEV